MRARLFAKRATSPASAAGAAGGHRPLSDKLDWLTNWAPTLAVLGALLIAGVSAVFYLGGEFGRINAELGSINGELSRLGGEIRRLDRGQVELKAGLARLDTLIGELRDELREVRDDVAEVREDVADVRERVSALEAAS